MSAFSTVGLPTGITADVRVIGLLLVALTSVCRLGPITLATEPAVRERTQRFGPPKERPIM